MKTVKRTLSLLLVLCLAAALCSGLSAYADTDGDVVTDDLGGGFTCVYNQTFHTLVLHGEGALPSFDGDEKAPWDDNKEVVTRIILDEGITAIPAGCFEGLTHLTSVVVPESVESIDADAFADCGCVNYVSTVGSTTALRELLKGIYAFRGAEVTRLSKASLVDEVRAMQTPYTTIGYYAYDPITDLERQAKREEKEQAIIAIRQYYGLSDTWLVD